MNLDIIEARLSSRLENAEHNFKVELSRVAANAAGRGTLHSSATVFLKIAKLGEELEAFVTDSLSDIPAIEAKGGDTTAFYETLLTKLIQLKLRGMEHINKGDSIKYVGRGAGVEVERLLTVSRDRIRFHQMGFDRSSDANPASVAGGNITVSSARDVLIQSHSPGASATFSINSASVQEATQQIETSIHWNQLQSAEAADLRAEIDTIKAQLAKSSPSPFILRESARTLRSLVENVSATAMTPTALAAASQLWVALGLG